MTGLRRRPDKKEARCPSPSVPGVNVYVPGLHDAFSGHELQKSYRTFTRLALGIHSLHCQARQQRLPGDEMYLISGLRLTMCPFSHASRKSKSTKEHSTRRSLRRKQSNPQNPNGDLGMPTSKTPQMLILPTPLQSSTLLPQLLRRQPQDIQSPHSLSMSLTSSKQEVPRKRRRMQHLTRRRYRLEDQMNQ